MTRHDMITINGRKYRKFIPYPEPINDGTLRCIRCGQIDEEEFHDHDLCVAALTPAKQAEGQNQDEAR